MCTTTTAYVRPFTYHHVAVNLLTGEVITAATANTLKRIVRQRIAVNRQYGEPNAGIGWHFAHDVTSFEELNRQFKERGLV